MLDEHGTEVDLDDLTPLHNEITVADFEELEKLDWWDIEVESDTGERYTLGPWVSYRGSYQQAMVCECDYRDELYEETDKLVALHPISPILYRYEAIREEGGVVLLVPYHA